MSKNELKETAAVAAVCDRRISPTFTDRRYRFSLGTRWLPVALLLAASAPAWGAEPIPLQDFESEFSPPKVWVVNIPNDNASVELSDEQPHDGKQSLKLNYRFVEEGEFQYLGIPIPIATEAPFQRLRYWVRGDGSRCSYGVQITDASGETHQFAKPKGNPELIDFSDWQEIVVDLQQGHETWGGDKNGRIDFPVASVTLTIGQPSEGGVRSAIESVLFFDSLNGESD